MLKKEEKNYFKDYLFRSHMLYGADFGRNFHHISLYRLRACVCVFMKILFSLVVMATSIVLLCEKFKLVFTTKPLQII